MPFNTQYSGIFGQWPGKPHKGKTSQRERVFIIMLQGKIRHSFIVKINLSQPNKLPRFPCKCCLDFCAISFLENSAKSAATLTSISVQRSKLSALDFCAYTAGNTYSTDNIKCCCTNLENYA